MGRETAKPSPFIPTSVPTRHRIDIRSEYNIVSSIPTGTRQKPPPAAAQLSSSSLFPMYTHNLMTVRSVSCHVLVVYAWLHHWSYPLSHNILTQVCCIQLLPSYDSGYKAHSLDYYIGLWATPHRLSPRINFYIHTGPPLWMNTEYIHPCTCTCVQILTPNKR